MIKEAKDLLESVIKNRIPNIPVFRSAAAETRAIMARQFPLISLITNPGGFDGSEARTVRFFDDGEYKERYVRGARVLPIMIRCWAKGEDEADAIFSRIIPAIPSQWGYDGFANHIEIGDEEHSDHAGNVNEMYLSVAVIKFKATAAIDPKEVPFFIEVKPEEGEIIYEQT